MARNLEKYFKKSEKISGEIKFVPEMTKKPSDPKSAVGISFLSYSYYSTDFRSFTLSKEGFSRSFLRALSLFFEYFSY